MKKILLSTIMCFITQLVFCQFSMTKNGIKNEKDLNASFVVFNYEGVSKNDIYTKALAAITSSFISPKDVISKVDNEAISVNGIIEDIPLGKSKALDNLEMNYTLVLNFKDGKMKAEIHINKLLTSYNELLKKRTDLSERDYGKIFTKDGSPNHTLTIDHINTYFNNLITKVDNNIKGSDENDNW